MIFVSDPAFNYRFFDKSFSMTKEMWHPNGPQETVDGYDIVKLVTKNMAFVDSRSELLIQAVDILASFLRRSLTGEVSGEHIAKALGRLQIYQKRKGRVQSLQILTLSGVRPTAPAELAKTVHRMTSAARIMFKPTRKLVA